MTANKPVFRPSFGNRPDQLIGRDVIIDDLMDSLQTFPGSYERATLIIGQRGMGKTALLLEIADKAKALDYISVRVTCGENMLDNLIELLQRAGSGYIKEPKSPVKGFNAGALGFSFGLTFTEEAQRSFGFRVKLEMICEKLSQAGKRVLILVDEVDPSLEQMRELATTYQELVGSEADIAIIMAGLPSSISNILNYKTLTFLNRAQRIALGLISIIDVEAYYHTAFARASIIANDQIISEAAAATDGFPFQIQLIGYYLSKYSLDGLPVDESVLEKAKNAASVEVDTKVFQAILNPLSNLDIKVINAIAECDGSITSTDLEKKTGLAHGTIQTYRKRLIDSGVIFSPRRGVLEFTLPQLTDYLKRTSAQ